MSDLIASREAGVLSECERQRAEFIEGVERVVQSVYGCTWTTPEHRRRVAVAALLVQDGWDAGLSRDAALFVGGECVFCGAEIPHPEDR